MRAACLSFRRRGTRPLWGNPCSLFHVPAAFLLLFACTAVMAQPPDSVPAPTASASAPPAPASSITTLQAINVTGVVPGPGLWKVSRGDHVMWVLGVVPTLPAGIEWRSAQVAQAIAGSQAVLESPGVKLKVDSNWFGKLFLLLPVYRAQRNPDGKTLHDVLPPAIYARWYYARERYFGDDYSVERYRPIIAAAKLMKKALKANNLRGDGEIRDAIEALAKQHGVARVDTRTTLEIRHPHQAVKAFVAAGPDGIACLGLVLDLVEKEIPDVRARANAWATGDIATLRRVRESAYRDTCKSAITGAGFAKSLGIENLPVEIEAHWLGAAEGALAANAQSFAVLPMPELLDSDGYLAALRARGYTIASPDDEAPGEAAPATSVAPASAGSVR
ncbi:MAG: TraB/GumN family protein [Rhodanobacteraceae bacterium]